MLLPPLLSPRSWQWVEPPLEQVPSGEALHLASLLQGKATPSALFLLLCAGGHVSLARLGP